MGRKLISLLYIITLWLFLGRFGHITQIEAVRYIDTEGKWEMILLVKMHFGQNIFVIAVERTKTSKVEPKVFQTSGHLL